MSAVRAAVDWLLFSDQLCTPLGMFGLVGFGAWLRGSHNKEDV